MDLMSLISMAPAIIFIVGGITGIIYFRKKDGGYTQIVIAEIVDFKQNTVKGRYIYNPVLRYEYNGIEYNVTSIDYSYKNKRDVEIGKKVEIKINSNYPENIYVQFKLRNIINNSNGVMAILILIIIGIIISIDPIIELIKFIFD